MNGKARIPALCLFWLCAAPVFAQSSASTEAVPRAAVLESLRGAITGTPYSALVIHTKVEITALSARSKNPKKTDPKKAAVADSDEERHVYYARVLETFKGKAYSTIRYEMTVEKGEGATLDSKPQLLTLCQGPRGFYWPGTGANFPADTDFITEARRVAKQPVTRAIVSDSQCD